jgi:hypothetical protein
LIFCVLLEIMRGSKEIKNMCKISVLVSIIEVLRMFCRLNLI